MSRSPPPSAFSEGSSWLTAEGAPRVWETWNADPKAAQLARPAARQWAAGGRDPALERAREGRTV